MPPRLTTTHPPLRTPRSITTPRTRIAIPHRALSIIPPRLPKILNASTKINPNTTTSPKTIPIPIQKRPLTTTPPKQNNHSSGKGKSQADLIIEEIQDLYETAKDEFEIATESTSSSTIYASSDRESARDALNHLLTVYMLYTASEPGVVQKQDGAEFGAELYTDPESEADFKSEVDSGAGAGARAASGSGGMKDEGEEEGEGRLVELAFDPVEVERSVKEEVRRRIGQRVRELKSAVEALEGRAKDD